jgi:hypothetical protein
MALDVALGQQVPQTLVRRCSVGRGRGGAYVYTLELEPVVESEGGITAKAYAERAGCSSARSSASECSDSDMRRRESSLCRVPVLTLRGTHACDLSGSSRIDG